MQRPAPAEGNILKRQWFKTYQVMPSRVDKYLLSLDATFKGSDKSDFVVMQCWAKVGAEFYLVDQIRDKMDFPTTIATFKMFCKKHPKAIRKLIEAKANGQAIIDTLKKEISGIIAVVPKESKESRTNAVSSYYESGNVYFLEDAPYLQDLIEECVVFPNGKHDDQVDAMTQALNDFTTNQSGGFTDSMLNPTIINNNSIHKGNW
jgi:predicted phage terminase large subunit-like protein